MLSVHSVLGTGLHALHIPHLYLKMEKLRHKADKMAQSGPQGGECWNWVQPWPQIQSPLLFPSPPQEERRKPETGMRPENMGVCVCVCARGQRGEAAGLGHTARKALWTGWVLLRPCSQVSSTAMSFRVLGQSEQPQVPHTHSGSQNSSPLDIIRINQAVVAYAFNPSTREAEAGSL